MCYFRIKKNILYLFRRLKGDKQIYEQDVMKYLKKVKHPVVLEAGAANGYNTLRFAKIFPHATVYAFEPVLKNFNMLKNTVSKLPNVKIFKLALGDFDGTSEINVSTIKDRPDSVAESSSLLKPTLHTTLFPDINFDKKETVTVRTIDSWASEHNVEKIDAMWLDMQGYEYSTLKASPHIFATVKVIYCEISLKHLYENDCLYDELKGWLIPRGFKIVMEEIQGDVGGNVLFVLEEMLKK